MLSLGLTFTARTHHATYVVAVHSNLLPIPSTSSKFHSYIMFPQTTAVWNILPRRCFLEQHWRNLIPSYPNKLHLFVTRVLYSVKLTVTHSDSFYQPGCIWIASVRWNVMLIRENKSSVLFRIYGSDSLSFGTMSSSNIYKLTYTHRHTHTHNIHIHTHTYVCIYVYACIYFFLLKLTLYLIIHLPSPQRPLNMSYLSTIEIHLLLTCFT